MSRCFPFPPPGYEKKARADDVDFFTKEKHKEKRHKKDKKREGKEKDKEKSKDKHKEKKDRKEKLKDKKKDKDREKPSDEKKIEGRPEAYNGEKPGENSQQVREIKDSKFVEELGRRIRDEKGTRNQMVENFTGTDQRRTEAMGRVVDNDNKKGTRNQMVENFTCPDQRRTQAMGRVVDKDIDSRGEGKKNVVDNKGVDRKTEGQRSKYEEKSLGITMVQNFSEMGQRRAEAMAKPLDKDGDKRMEGKEKNKDQKNDNKKGDRHKDKDGEKKSKAKTKNRDKKKEKEEEKGVHKNNKQDELRESGKKGPTDTLITKPLHITKVRDMNDAPEGNHWKRKDFDTNGFLHDNLTRPNKLPRPAFSSHTPFKENGRKLEPCQTASLMHGGPTNHKTDSKDHKVNGIIEAQPSSLNSTRPLFATVQTVENGEATMKPPHPDSKYLSEILSVPKMGEWSDFDDQGWLFNNNCSQLKKPGLYSGVIKDTPQVWEKAVRIESADVSALPYVIPY